METKEKQMKLNEYISKMGWKETNKHITFELINQGYCKDNFSYHGCQAQHDKELKLMDHIIKMVDTNNEPVAIITQPYNYTPEHLVYDNNLINADNITAEYLPDVEARWHDMCSVIVYRKSTKSEEVFYKLNEKR